MFVIYSVFNTDSTDRENELRHLKEMKELRALGVQFKECVGVYKGTREYSILVDREWKNLVSSRAWLYKQECILLVNAQHTAMLVYPDRVERIGTWQAVADEFNGDYTIINGRKYAVR